MSKAEKEFGKVSFEQLVELIHLINMLPTEKTLLFEEYKKQSDKLRTILDKDFAWGVLYEYTLAELIGYFSTISGFTQKLAELAESNDPTEAAIAAAYQDNSTLFPSANDELDKRKFIFGAHMALTKSIESIRTYGLPIHLLIDRVKRGHDSTLFKVLRLDRSAVSCPSIADRIALAELEDDQLFFKKLRNALNGPPQKPRDEYGVLRYILYLLNEDNVLDRLSLERQYQLFCVQLKLYPTDGEDPAKSLDQFIRRWKKEFST